MSLVRRTNYTPNTIIDADIHNLEHDDYVAGINQAVKRTGDEVISGSKGFSSVPYTTGGDPQIDNALTRKKFVLEQDQLTAGLFQGYIFSAVPNYLSDTSVSISFFTVRNSLNSKTIQKKTNTVLDLSVTGLNGSAQSDTLEGTVGTSGSPSTTVEGVGTFFLRDFVVGDVLWTTGGARRITAIATNTSLTIQSSLTLANGTSYKRGGATVNTWYNLYALSDENSTGLFATTRNLAAQDTIVDLPFTPTLSLPGTVSTTQGSADVTGSGTSFLADFQVGDNILISEGNELTIASIIDNVTLTATNLASVTVSGKEYSRVRYNIRQFPFALRTNPSGDLLRFQVGEGWPYRPVIYYRYSDGGTSSVGDGNVLNSGASASYADVNLAAFVPPISRCVILKKAWWSNSGTIASSLRGKGDPFNGSYDSSGSSVPEIRQIHLNTDANQLIQYAHGGSSNGRTSLWVLGYVVTEV
jgi:hypothetical protein